MKNDMETKNHKKPMIEYLDINETYYIENDKVKLHLNEDFAPKQGTWDEVWGDALEIIKKAREYDETHNTNK